MSEKALQNSIIRWIAKKQSAGVPIHHLKIHGNGMQRSGEPDLIICYDGRFFAVELKHGSNKPTDLQKHRLKQWEKAGAVSAVVYSLDQLRKILTENGIAIL